MAIFEIPTYVQIDGILERKRKNELYNVLHYFPVEIQEVNIEDTNVVSFQVRNIFSSRRANNDINDNNSKNLHVVPYLEYNDSLYEPYRLYSDNASIENNENQNDFFENLLKQCFEKTGLDLPPVDSVSTYGGLTQEEFTNYTMQDNKFFKLGEEDLPCVKQNDFKKVFSDNIDYRKKFAQDFADHLLFIDNQLYRKTYGPVLKKIFNSLSSTSYVNASFSPIKRFFNKGNSIGNFLPYSLMSHMTGEHSGYDKIVSSRYLERNKSAIHHNYPHLIVLDQERLHETTKNDLGYFFFLLSFNNLNGYPHYASSGVPSDSPELKRDTWFKYLEDRYEFGKELTTHYQMMIDSDYDLEVVFNALKTFQEYLPQVSDKRKYTTSMQKYLPPTTKFKINKNSKSKLPSDRYMFENIILQNIKDYFDNIPHTFFYNNKNVKNFLGENISLYEDFSQLNLKPDLSEKNILLMR